MTPTLPASYTRIVLTLTRRPGLTRDEIAEQAYIASTTLSGGGYLRHMKELGLLYISGWRRNANGAFTIPQYSAGRGHDYPRPNLTADLREAPGMQRLREAIDRYGPLDYRQAARLAGLSPNTVKNAGYLQALVAQGIVFIGGWRRARNGPPRPLYEVGTGHAAPTLTPLTGAEKSRRHRARKAAANAGTSLVAQLLRTNQGF